MISLMLPIAPIPKGRPRFTRQGHAYTPQATRGFESRVAGILRAQFWGKPLLGPLRLSLTFVLARPKSTKRVYPSVRPDLDNFEKGVMDAANGILWEDDAQIVRKESWKVYGPTPHITLAVEQLDRTATNGKEATQ